MEKLSGVFIGYKDFVSPKNGKHLFIISFVFIVPDNENKKADYFVKDLFLSEKEYNGFLSKYALLSPVDVSREIVGDKVRYYI